MYTSSDELTLVDGPRIEAQYGRVEVEKFIKLRPLIEAMAAARRDLTVSPVESEAHRFIDEIVGNHLLSESIDDRGVFDIPQWLERMGSLHLSGSLQPIIGATYVPTNVEILAGMVEGASLPQGLVKARDRIVWHRPRGTAWAVTPDINLAVNRLKLAWRNVTREDGNIPVTLIDVHRTPKDSLRTFKPVFDRCISIWSRAALSSLDVVIVGQLAAAFTVRVDLGNGALVAIGYACADHEALVRLSRAIGLEDKLKAGSMLWPADA